MKLTYPIIGLFFYILFCPFMSYSQGCVAIRPMGCSGGELGNGLGILTKGSWQFSGDYQYFKSFRHFRGSTEEHERIENNTQVENFSHAVDFGVRMAVTTRINVSANLPILHYKRTSLYEHYGNSIERNPNRERFATNSFGIGDLRLTGNFWLFDPLNVESKGNLSLGAGIKLPTGNSNVQGDFHKIASDGSDSIVTKAVDQSIQLGDGGWGIITQFQGMRKLFKGATLFANGFYMISPMATNNTISRGTLVGVDPLIAYHSIPDQFSLRIGLNYRLPFAQNFSVSLGGRFEGIPSHDLFGSSEGYRRPGHVLSVEPSVSYSKQNISLTLAAPFATYRNRVKSVYDLADPSGTKHGDAAFADYLINFTLAYRLHPKQKSHSDM